MHSDQYRKGVYGRGKWSNQFCRTTCTLLELFLHYVLTLSSYLHQGGSVFTHVRLLVYLIAGLSKNYWTDFHPTWWREEPIQYLCWCELRGWIQEQYFTFFNYFWWQMNNLGYQTLSFRTRQSCVGVFGLGGGVVSWFWYSGALCTWTNSFREGIMQNSRLTVSIELPLHKRDFF